MNLKRYFKFLSTHIASQLQYRASFIMSVLARMFLVGTQFLSAYFLILKFRENSIFTLTEIIICFVTVTLGLHLSELFFRGFDTFSMIVSSGLYDRILLRPQSEITQIIDFKIDLSRIGSVIQNTILLILLVPSMNVNWTLDKILLFIMMILGSFIIYNGVFILGAALCFYTTEGLEVMNILNSGTQNFGVYPFKVLGKEVLSFLTFVVPLALCQQYPMEYLTGKNTSHLVFLMPLISLPFFFITILVFKKASKVYKSIGA